MPRAEPSRARQSYSQWRICCRDSLILRVYGLLKGFAHCISSSLGQRLSNLITLRHWNYCNMLYCRQHSQCVCLPLCVCEWFYWPDESLMISLTCVRVCVCVAATAQRRIPRVNIRGNIQGIFAIYIMLYLQISNYNCKHNYAAILFRNKLSAAMCALLHSGTEKGDSWE